MDARFSRTPAPGTRAENRRGESGTVAAVLAHAYNEYAAAHMTPSDSAEGSSETMTGHVFVVMRHGQRYVVTVTHESASALMSCEPRPEGYR